jgi:ferric-dicitrate binding protein FerR (iron transport regulator)
MDYSAYDTADFVCDDSFVAWVKEGKNGGHWENVIAHYPGQREAILQARAIIKAAAQLPTFQLKEQEQQLMWQEIQSRMEEKKTVIVKRGRSNYWYWAAAAVFIIGGITLWRLLPSQPASVYSRLLQDAKLEGNKRVEEVNESAGPKTISLPDGSSVVLEPGARISYPVCKDATCKREVYLSGAAFFEVSRNTMRPFVVYANEMVINVLGTSFHVKAYEKDSLVALQVKTGKVAIAVRPLGNKFVANISANQAAVLKRTTLAVAVQEPAQQTKIKKENETVNYSFVFNDATVDSVMTTIENAYGVHISYDKALLADCRLTASLSDEPLYEKIRLICKALEAGCIIEGNEIKLTARGCHPNVIEN